MAFQAVLWQSEQPAVCAAAVLKETEQELWTGNLAVGDQNSTHSGQAGIILDLKMPVMNKYNLGTGFQKRTCDSYVLTGPGAGGVG